MPEVVIVGAGYAGLACAVKLLENGIKPHIIEQRAQPQAHTTGGYANFWVKQFEQPPEEVIAADIRGLRLVSPYKTEALIRAHGQLGGILYPEKYLEYYISKVKKLGVDFIAPATFTGVDTDGGYVTYNQDGDEKRMKFNYLIGADGANSRVRHVLGLSELDPEDLHYGYEETIDNVISHESDVITLVTNSKFARLGYAWIFPSDKGKTIRVGLGIPKLLGQNPKENYRDFLEYLGIKNPTALKVVGGQIPTADAPKTNVYGKNVAFIGDAGRQCDSLTGGGIAFGVIAGSLVAGAIIEGNLKLYDTMWKKELGVLLRRHYILKSLLATWNDDKMDLAIKALRDFPANIGEDFDPKDEFMYFLAHLVKHYPKLIPSMVRLRLGV